MAAAATGKNYALKGLKWAAGGAGVATVGYVFGGVDPTVRRQMYLWTQLARPLMVYKYTEFITRVQNVSEDEKKVRFDALNQKYGPIFSETLDEMRGYYFNLAEIAWKPTERTFSMRRSYSVKRARSTLPDGSMLMYTKCRGANVSRDGKHLVFTNTPGDDEDWCAAGIRPTQSGHRLGMVGAQVAWLFDNTDEIKYQGLVRGGLGDELEGIDYGNGKKITNMKAVAKDGTWTFEFPMDEVRNIVDNADEVELVWACGDGDAIGPHAHATRGKQLVPTKRLG